MFAIKRTFIVITALALAGAPVAAQQFTSHSVTSLDMGGALGKMASFAMKMGGGGKETVQTTYLSGHKLRTETGDMATIIDADAGRITTINNRDKTYSTMTFEEMAAAMRQGREERRESMNREKQKNKEQGDVDMKWSAKVDATGEQEKISGYDARRVVMTL